MTEKTYRCLGIMTGNSLDAIDVVVTEFCNREIRDIGFFSQEFPRQMAQRFRAVKRFLAENDGDIEAAIAHPQLALDSLIDDYTSAVAAAVNNALQTNGIPAASVDAIGFHGQTCAHCPPSVSTTDTYTLQVGNGQMLADLTGIPVIFDFRSDDLMNGGEGAPFAPAHNLHLAYSLRQRGIFPVAFCNGGNTGNIAVISARTQKGKAGVCGFDTGPFNHFVDYLARTEQNLPCDLDGGCGRLGKSITPFCANCLTKPLSPATDVISFCASLPNLPILPGIKLSRLLPIPQQALPTGFAPRSSSAPIFLYMH